MTETLAPSDAPPAQSRRALWWTVAIVAVAAVAAPLTWWNIAAHTARIEAGSFWADGASMLTAGDSTEMCFPYRVGGTITFGYVIDNPGSYAIRITAIEPGFQRMPQQVSLSRTDDEDASEPFHPVTLESHANMEINVVIQIVTDPAFGEGKHAFFGSMRYHYRVLGQSFVRDVPLNFFVGTAWPPAGQQACTSQPPPAP